jgi:hypothetical protein
MSRGAAGRIITPSVVLNSALPCGVAILVAVPIPYGTVSLVPATAHWRGGWAPTLALRANIHLQQGRQIILSHVEPDLAAVGE